MMYMAVFRPAGGSYSRATGGVPLSHLISDSLLGCGSLRYHPKCQALTQGDGLLSGSIVAVAASIVARANCCKSLLGSFP